MIVSASNFPDTQSCVFLESLNLHTVRSTHAEESFTSSHAVLPPDRRIRLFSSCWRRDCDHQFIINPSLLMTDSVCLFLFSVKAPYLDQDRTRWNNDHVGHEVLKKMFLHNWPHVGSGRYYERHAGSESAVAVFLSQTWISKQSMLLLTFQSAFELLQHNN